MNRFYSLALALVVLLGSIEDGSSAHSERLSSTQGVVDDKVKAILVKIASSSLVNPAYKLDNIVIDIKSGGTKLDGFIDGKITGIPQTQLTKNHFAPIGFKHSVSLHVPRLAAKGDYELQGVLAGILNLNGVGPFLLELTDVDIDVVVYMAAVTRLPELYPKNVTVEFTAGKFFVNVEEILGDLSDAFNKMVNEIAPEIFAAYQPQVETLLADLLLDLLKDLLGNGSLGKVDPALASDSGAAGEMDVDQVIARIAAGEVDSSRINAAIGKIVNSFVKMMIDKVSL